MNKMKMMLVMLVACGVSVVSQKMVSAEDLKDVVKKEAAAVVEKIMEPAMDKVAGQEVEKAVAEMDPKQAEMMKKWQEYSTPGEAHKVLDQLVGSWDYEMKWWMAAEGPAEESKGTSEVSWMMNGRFIQHKVVGTSMGQPFEGLSVTGYDNIKKEYQMIWLDNMSTGMMKSAAKYDAATKTLAEAGSMSCPMVNGDRSFRAVTTFVDADHFKYEMFMTGEDGKEYRSMEISYSRKK